MKLIRARNEHITEVARLFELYRQFYQCKPDIELATTFIRERINNDESVIFVAIDDNQAKGFVQLYASFCSVEAIKIYILYDLYVDAGARKFGIGEDLMNKASEYAKDNDAMRVDLSTAFTNKAGQHLYEKLGYKIVDEDFHAYSLAL